MLTRTKKTALETIEWVGIGVVLIIVAVAAYKSLGGKVGEWVNTIASSIGG